MTMASDLARDALEPCHIRDYAQEYEFRMDNGGGYTPTEAERAMIEDAINGFLSEPRARTAYDAIGPGVEAEPVTPDLQWGKRTPEGSWLACNNRDKLAEITAHFEGPIVPVTVEWDTNDDCKIEPALSTHTDAGAGPVGEAVARAPASESRPLIAENRWHLGAMNDGLFIIDKAPGLTTDAGPWDREDGPKMVLNVVALTHDQAKAIVDAHNSAIAAMIATHPVEEPGEVERLTRERDEWKASSAMYETAAAEGARGIEALEEIDAAWDAFGTRGNRNVLTLAEQIASLDREVETAEAALAETRKALRYIAEGNLGSEPWQANYERIKDAARAALTGDAQDGEPGASFGARHSIAHDGFVGTVIGHYTRLDGKRGVVLQQDGTKVVHVYGEKWLAPAGDA